MTATDAGVVLTSAACVAAEHDGEWRALLISGPSGSGKSTLALRMMAFGARLIADEAVRLRRDGSIIRPSAMCPGLIEARGLGLLAAPSFCGAAALALHIRLKPQSAAEKMEADLRRTPRLRTQSMLNVGIPFIETTTGDSLAPALICVLRGGALLDPDAGL